MAFEIEEEVTLAEIPRGTDTLRITRVRARTDRGVSVYTSLRVFFRGDAGDLRPGKAGITIRDGELPEVLASLEKVLAKLRAGK